MKKILIILCALAPFLDACSKHTSTVTPIVPMDTILIQFFANGVLYHWTDTVPLADSGQGQNLIRLSYSTPPSQIYGLAANMESFELALAINAQPPFTPGTYPLITDLSDSIVAVHLGTFQYIGDAGLSWTFDLLRSDTVTVTSVTGGYASGTFSATLDSSYTNPTPVHLTDGVFRNLPVRINN